MKSIFPFLNGFETSFLRRIPKRTSVSELSFGTDRHKEVDPFVDQYFGKLQFFHTFSVPRGLERRYREATAHRSRVELTSYIFRGLTERLDDMRDQLFLLRQTVDPSSSAYDAVEKLSNSFSELCREVRGEINE